MANDLGASRGSGGERHGVADNEPVREASRVEPPSPELARGALEGAGRTADRALEGTVEPATTNHELVGKAVEEAAGPVLGTAGSAVEPVAEAIEPVVDQAGETVAPVLEPVEDVADPITTPILGSQLQEDPADAGPADEIAGPAPAGDAAPALEPVAGKEVFSGDDYAASLPQTGEALALQPVILVSKDAYDLSGFGPALSNTRGSVEAEGTNSSLAFKSAIAAQEENFERSSPRWSAEEQAPATDRRPGPYSTQIKPPLTGANWLAAALASAAGALNQMPKPFSSGAMPMGSFSAGSGTGTGAGIGLGILALFLFLLPGLRSLWSIHEFPRPDPILLPIIERPG